MVSPQDGCGETRVNVNIFFFKVNTVLQGSYSLEVSKFHNFPWTFQWLSHYFPWLFIIKKCNGKKLWVSYLMRESKSVLRFKINIVFNNFPWHRTNSIIFQAWKNENLKYHDFPGFPWPVQLLNYHFITTRYISQHTWIDTPKLFPSSILGIRSWIHILTFMKKKHEWAKFLWKYIKFKCKTL